MDQTLTDPLRTNRNINKTVIIQPAATSPSPKSGQKSATDIATSTAPASTASTTATTSTP
jgi:hypothetical protein